jgi:hypothetical protein
MRIILRFILVIAAALAGGVVGFVATFAVIAFTEKCPPNVHVCDVGPIAGAGLGLIVAPIAAFVAGWLATRRLWRRQPTAVDAAI